MTPKPTPTPPAAESSPGTDDAQWVEGKLIGALMANDRVAHRWVVLVLPIMFGILYNAVSFIPLVIWAVAASAIAIVRMLLIRRYYDAADTAPLPARHDFMQRYGWTWPLSGLIWGSSTLLLIGSTPTMQQSLCWLIIAGLSGHAVTSFSAHLPTMKSYVGMLGLASLVSTVIRLVLAPSPMDSTFDLWLLLLIVAFWQLLIQTGKRLHATYRRNFELQLNNRHLIESLTQQSRAAVNAMDIKNRFLASAAHDIRQPVHALSLYAELLAAEPHMVDEIAPKIVKSTKAVNALFDSLFDLVRLDSGKIRIKVESIDLPRLLRDLDLQYRPRAEAKGLQFRVRVLEGELLSDPLLLKRVLGNLLDNAIKYSNTGGILLAARFAHDRVRIEIHDTGIGIAPEHQKDVFQEFYKVPVSAGTDDGFGLGLAIVARLTSVLGHRLTMSSTLARGTTFRLEVQSLDTMDSDQRAAALTAQLARRP